MCLPFPNILKIKRRFFVKKLQKLAFFIENTLLKSIFRTATNKLGYIMILEIGLKNFFSIRDEIVLDLRPAKAKSEKMRALESNTFSINKEKALKSIVLYGANASGKSNIIEAIRFCCAMVYNSHNHNQDANFNFKPFKFNKSLKPSEFSINFILEEIEYEYSFSLLNNEIITESLYYYPKDRKAKIFERDETLGITKKEKYSFTNRFVPRALDVAENTSNKTLYISRASQMDREIGKKVFNFFNSQFILNYIPRDVNDIVNILKTKKEFILNGLQEADIDIVDIDYELKEVEEKSFIIDTLKKELVKEGYETKKVPIINIFTYHKPNPKIAFNWMEESGGTRKLFDVLVRFADILENGKTIIIDELGEKLHPALMRYIVKMFHKSEQAQIIFATHNTIILDFDLMRKDQIYFVEKDEMGASELYSLFDFKDFRENMNPEISYLNGRFGAIPNV